MSFSLYQIRAVRNEIRRWQKEHGNEYDYPISPIYPEGYDISWGEMEPDVSREEHKNIIKYLATKGFIEFLGEEPSGDIITIRVLPEVERPIKQKTLELVSRELAEHYTGNRIVKLLKNCGVDEKLIIYPQTKWRIFYDIFEELSQSKDKADTRLLEKVISEAVHPLNLDGNEILSEQLIQKFNNYLRYDNAYISFDEAMNTYELCFLPSKLEREEIEAEMDANLAQQEKEELMFLRQPENREKISLLRKAHKSLMDIVYTFCENPSHPTQELNDAYQFLKKLVLEIIDGLSLRQKYICGFSSYTLPFTNLFAAEKQYRELKKELSWQKIRPEMNAMYGEIEELYQKVNGSDVLAEPDIQKKLNRIEIMQLVLLVQKQKREMAKKMQIREVVKPVVPTAKIEITKLPELQIKGFEEKVVLQKPKNKKIQLRNFPTDLRWEEISIQFLNEHEVIVKARNETLQTTYEAMGFQDEKKKLPNKQWQFLRLLALKNGEVSWENNQNLPLKQINSIKKQKQLLTEALKAYFQIYDSEPFQDYKAEKAYRIKITLTPEPE